MIKNYIENSPTKKQILILCYNGCQELLNQLLLVLENPKLEPNFKELSISKSLS